MDDGYNVNGVDLTEEEWEKFRAAMVERELYAIERIVNSFDRLPIWQIAVLVLAAIVIVLRVAALVMYLAA